MLALIDPLHPDLDYLRADPSAGEKARAERGGVAPPVAAATQPAAVTVMGCCAMAREAAALVEAMPAQVTVRVNTDSQSDSKVIE